MGPVHAGAFVDAFGDVGSVDAEFAKETGQDVRWVLAPRVSAAEIAVQLAIGKLARDLVRDMNRERRLADAGLAGQADDREGGSGASGCRGDQAGDLVHLLSAAGEITRVRGKVEQRTTAATVNADEFPDPLRSAHESGGPGRNAAPSGRGRPGGSVVGGPAELDGAGME